MDVCAYFLFNNNVEIMRFHQRFCTFIYYSTDKELLKTSNIEELYSKNILLLIITYTRFFTRIILFPSVPCTCTPRERTADHILHSKLVLSGSGSDNVGKCCMWQWQW